MGKPEDPAVGNTMNVNRARPGLNAIYSENIVSEISAETKKSPYEIREMFKGAPELSRGYRELMIDFKEKIVADIIAAVQSGANVPAEHLAQLVQDGCPLPQDVREHIAGRLSGKIKPKGRPVAHLHSNAAAIKKFESAVADEATLYSYRMFFAIAREMKKDNPAAYNNLRKELKRPRAAPSEVALAMIAKSPGRTYDSVRNAVKRASKK